MPDQFKFVAALLMLVFALASGLAALPFEAVAQFPASGCHHPDHQSPAPQSTDYSCCKNGHSTALLQSSCMVEIECLQSDVVSLASPISSQSSSRTDLIFPSEGPPSFVPLRI